MLNLIVVVAIIVECIVMENTRLVLLLCYEGCFDNIGSIRFLSYMCYSCFFGQHQNNSFRAWSFFFETVVQQQSRLNLIFSVQFEYNSFQLLRTTSSCISVAIWLLLVMAISSAEYNMSKSTIRKPTYMTLFLWQTDDMLFSISSLASTMNLCWSLSHSSLSLHSSLLV